MADVSNLYKTMPTSTSSRVACSSIRPLQPSTSLADIMGLQPARCHWPKKPKETQHLQTEKVQTQNPMPKVVFWKWQERGEVTLENQTPWVP